VTPKSDKREDYARYAAYCMKLVAATTDQEAKAIRREMAAEWLKLAEAVQRPWRSGQMQMQ
jgi:hypothetical protein